MTNKFSAKIVEIEKFENHNIIYCVLTIVNDRNIKAKSVISHKRFKYLKEKYNIYDFYVNQNLSVVRNFDNANNTFYFQIINIDK